MYRQYEKQEYCNVTLQSGDDYIQIHSTVLMVRGGSLFKTLLTSGLSEETEKRIFSDWAMAFLNPKELTAGEAANKARIDLERLAGSSPESELNMEAFWQNIRKLLKDVGYYQL